MNILISSQMLEREKVLVRVAAHPLPKAPSHKDTQRKRKEKEKNVFPWQK